MRSIVRPIVRRIVQFKQPELGKVSHREATQSLAVAASARVRDSLILSPEPVGQAGYVIMLFGLRAMHCDLERAFSRRRGMAWFEMSRDMAPEYQLTERLEAVAWRHKKGLPPMVGGLGQCSWSGDRA